MAGPVAAVVGSGGGWSLKKTPSSTAKRSIFASDRISVFKTTGLARKPHTRLNKPYPLAAVATSLIVGTIYC